MERRSIACVLFAAALACACGGSGGAVGLEPSGSGDGSDSGSPVVPAPEATAEPIAPATSSPTPEVVAETWRSEAALYLSPPADGVLRPVAELACRAEGFCPQIVLIGCTGPTLRTGTSLVGTNRCRSLPGSAAVLDEFVVETEGEFDPATGVSTVRGVTPVGGGFSYGYDVVTQQLADGTMRGSGLVDGIWPLVITGERVD